MENMFMDKAMSECNNKRPVRIVVVDDHPNTATTFARALSQLHGGLSVISATSGKQALEFANQDPIDILITDMMMPGMNGLELIELLQGHPAGRPIHTILMTAYDVPGLKETARRLKVHDTIIKPVPPERICQIVKQVIANLGSVNVPLETKEVPQRFKIMIADDIPDNVNLLSRYIKNEGYSYVTASNGVEVLQKARLEMPDLILLDVNMPEKDGFTALQELRADSEIKHIPVIILTAARPSPDDIHRGLSFGADDYVTKPFDKRELLARIRTKLRVKEAEDVIRRRNKELSVLPEIGRELGAITDINELTDVVLRRTVETLGALVGHLIIFSPKGPLHKEYHLAAIETGASRVQLPPLNIFLNQIKENRQPLIINDIREDERWQAMPDDPTRSVILLPMFGRFELLGLLALNHERAGYFNMEHQLLLQAIASQASIAVENTWLHMDILQEEQKLAAVLGSAADAIMMFDADGCLSVLNPAAEKMFTDYRTKLGLPLARNCGYDQLIGFLEDVLASGKSRIEEILWPDQRVLSASFTPVERGGCVVLLHDVSHFKALERVKDEFIATASHDLKNPITAITGFSQLLPAAGPLNAQQQEFAHRIQFAADNMRELVENMLDLAKSDLGTKSKHEVLDVTSLLWEIADEFQPQAAAKKQLLTFEKTESSSKVPGDALQLRQVLRNLIGNAVKYTPDGGAITLSLENQSNTVDIKIKDTGYGIPASDLPHIFERFYRVRNNGHDEIEGNGLGLAIVKSIAQQHGGDVSVESKIGEGSCFTVSLPLATVAEV
jgi:two-component system phosphate regulon sensor histidine kinase PhoR